MRSDSDSRLRELRPKCQQIAYWLIRDRDLPAFVRADELVQAGMVGAWQALQRYDGRVPLEAFAFIRIRGAMLDYMRTEHVHGQRLYRAELVSLDEAMHIPGDSDPAADLERKECAQARLALLSERERGIVEQVLDGVPQADIGARLGVSFSRVSQMVAGIVRKLESWSPVGA